MSTNTNTNTAAKAQFIFELSQSIKRLEQESKTNRERTDDLESRMTAEFTSVKEAQNKQQQSLLKLNEGLKSLSARISSLEDWRDNVVGKNLEHVEKKFAQVAAAMEQRLEDNIKLREAGTWGIFNKKFDAEKEDNIHERDIVAQTWSAEFKRHQERVSKDMEERLAEFTSAGKAFRESAKTIEKVNSDSKKVNSLLERLTDELSKFEVLRKETIAKIASGKLFVESSPTSESGKIIAEMQKLSVEAARQKESVEMAIDKLNKDHKEFSDKIFSEIHNLKTEQIKTVREEVEKRFVEEIEWNTAGGNRRNFSASPKKDKSDDVVGDDDDGNSNNSKKVKEEVAAVAAAPATIVSVVDAADAPVDEVGKWLEEIGMEQYHQAFIESGFDTILSLKMLDDDDLESMGVTILGHKRIILTAAKALANTIHLNI